MYIEYQFYCVILNQRSQSTTYASKKEGGVKEGPSKTPGRNRGRLNRTCKEGAILQVDNCDNYTPWHEMNRFSVKMIRQ